MVSEDHQSGEGQITQIQKFQASEINIFQVREIPMGSGLVDFLGIEVPGGVVPGGDCRVALAPKKIGLKCVNV